MLNLSTTIFGIPPSAAGPSRRARKYWFVYRELVTVSGAADRARGRPDGSTAWVEVLVFVVVRVCRAGSRAPPDELKSKQGLRGMLEELFRRGRHQKKRERLFFDSKTAALLRRHVKLYRVSFRPGSKRAESGMLIKRQIIILKCGLCMAKTCEREIERNQLISLSFRFQKQAEIAEDTFDALYSMTSVKRMFYGNERQNTLDDTSVSNKRGVIPFENHTRKDKSCTRWGGSDIRATFARGSDLQHEVW